MLTDKIVITGTVVRIEPDKIVVVRGETIDTYNPNYYRVLPDRPESEDAHA